MRLIDADALKNELTSICSDKVNDYNKAVKAFIEFIDNAPTVEPTFREVVAYECGQKSVERQKSEWIIDGHHYKCSRCGKILAIMFSETDDDDLIGCPFCLADMRGGKQ